MDLITIRLENSGSVRMSVRKHETVADVGKEDHGNDEGPSPVEWMVASLGACMTMMVGHYCREHGYNAKELETTLTFQMAKDPKRVSAITVDMKVPSDVPPEKHEALRRIAEKCPIHATLSHPPVVDLEIL